MSRDSEDDAALRAFAEALKSSDDSQKLVSINDWAPTHPINTLVGENRRRKLDNDHGLAYVLLRWPLLAIMVIYIEMLLLVYAYLRTYVALSEWLFVWRGRRRELRQRLRKAESYEQWQGWAAILDNYLGLSSWKRDPRSAFYDYRTVATLVRQLTSRKTSPQELAVILEACVRYNFAGTHNAQLYSQCYSGTKDSVNAFNTVMVAKLNEVAAARALAPEVRLALFRSLDKNLGRSALCLSGGASFAYRHFGVVKALLDQDMLPNIVSGTSGGGLVAALVCTRTNSELKQLLDPEIISSHLTACWEPFPAWVKRWWRTGARFDSVDWAARARWFTLGDMTFREAYERTGKILNISTVPADANSPAILCNHITSPDCVIWSALLASAAVPGILNPVVLLMKVRHTGEFVPYSFGSKWKDGSLRTDIPLQALNTYFNVNFYIVSQVNPHIKLFAYLPRGQVGRPVSHKFSKSRWRGGFLLSAAESFVKLEIQKCLKLLRVLDLVPHMLDQDWSNVFLQRFEGSVTVWPKIGIADFWRILADPTSAQLMDMMRAGERTMYPKLVMIRHFVELERAVHRGLTRAERETASAQIAPSRSHGYSPGGRRSSREYSTI